MKTRKILALLLAVLMTIGCLAACTGNGGEQTDPAGSQTETQGTVDNDAAAAAANAFNADFISEWGQFVADNEGTEINLRIWAPSLAQDVVKAEAAKFAEMFKDYFTANITVEIQEEGDTASQVINDPKKAADVYSFPSDQLNKLVNAEAIASVAFSDEVAVLNTANSVSAATIDGTLYAYPSTVNSYFLAYDKRVITDEDAKTLEGLLAACKAADKKFTFDSGNSYFACTYLYTGGLQTLGYQEDGLTQKFNEYDIDEVTNTVKAFADLFKSYKGTFESVSTTGFADGVKVDPTTVAAGVVGSWDVASINQILGDNVGYAILPTINVNGTDKPMINMFGYKYFGVNSQSAAPYAAQLLSYWLTGEECQIDRAKQLDWGPLNIKAQEIEEVKNDAAMTAVLAQSENSMPQVSLAQTFWTPLDGLGKYVADDSKSFAFEEVKEQVEACIVNILDE